MLATPKYAAATSGIAIQYPLRDSGHRARSRALAPLELNVMSEVIVDDFRRRLMPRRISVPSLLQAGNHTPQTWGFF
jgi:hypothetical protein